MPAELRSLSPADPAQLGEERPSDQSVVFVRGLQLPTAEKDAWPDVGQRGSHQHHRLFIRPQRIRSPISQVLSNEWRKTIGRKFYT